MAGKIPFAFSTLRLLSAGLTIALGLSACASTPRGVLLPVGGGTPGTTPVEMLVATTRGEALSDGEMFSGERGGGVMSFARITVSIPPADARQIGDVQWPRSVPGNPATDFVTLKAERVDQKTAMKLFDRKVASRPRRSVLVFIHGFNNRFEDAVFRFAQIVHDSGSDVVPVLFTWPSRGSVFGYGFDRESNNYSRDALENLLTTLARDPAVGEISILAHSMGNWVTMEALRQMAIRSGQIAPKIRNVMLAAPDVDVDVFRSQFSQLGNRRPEFTLFVSQDDRALALSRRVWGSTARLGAIDPEQEPYRTELEREKINVLDLTKLRTGDRLNHAKFAQSPDVVQLIGQRLANQKTITDSRVGLGERIVQVTTGAAATVGNAAGLIISAPVAVVDPRTRDNLGYQLEEFGKQIGDSANATGELLTKAPVEATRRGP